MDCASCGLENLHMMTVSQIQIKSTPGMQKQSSIEYQKWLKVVLNPGIRLIWVREEEVTLLFVP